MEVTKKSEIIDVRSRDEVKASRDPPETSRDHSETRRSRDPPAHVVEAAAPILASFPAPTGVPPPLPISSSPASTGATETVRKGAFEFSATSEAAGAFKHSAPRLSEREEFWRENSAAGSDGETAGCESEIGGQFGGRTTVFRETDLSDLRNRKMINSGILNLKISFFKA